MKKFWQKLLSLVLALCMTAGLMPATAFATNTADTTNTASTSDISISEGAASLTTNKTVVAFAGYEWYVIGQSGEKGGVYTSPQNSITLFAKSSETDWTVPFRESSETSGEGFSGSFNLL